MNYLQYIGSVNQNNNQLAQVSFLVSGADVTVSDMIEQNIIDSAYNRQKSFFIIDNTRNCRGMTINSRFRIVNMLDVGLGVEDNLFNVESLANVSFLRSLLSDFGFDGIRAMKVVSYIKFVKATEERLGNTNPLSVGVLEEYGSPLLVEMKLNQLLEAGTISEFNYRYLLGRYSELSAAAADFEQFLEMVSPFLGRHCLMNGSAVYLPVGQFYADQQLQNIMCKLLVSYVKGRPNQSCILILDDGNSGERDFLVNVLRSLSQLVEVHMISNDVFNFDDSDRNTIMQTFSVKIYTRHEDMSSCEKIEAACGQIDVVKRSSSVTVDRRFRANSAWDLLLGNDKTETQTLNAPTKEYRFRKEMINSLPLGNGIIDCGGNKVLFSFL